MKYFCNPSDYPVYLSMYPPCGTTLPFLIGPTGKSFHQPTTTEANKQLLSQLDDMRMERKKLQEQFDDERRMLQYDAR